MKSLKNKCMAFLLAITMVYSTLTPTISYATSLAERIKTMSIEEIQELDIREVEALAIEQLKNTGFSDKEIEEVLTLNPITKDSILGEVGLEAMSENSTRTPFDEIKSSLGISTFASDGDIQESTIRVTIHQATGWGTVAGGALGWGLSQVQWTSLITSLLGWGLVIAYGLIAVVAGSIAYTYLSEHEIVYITFVKRYQYDPYEGMGKWYLVNVRHRVG